MTLPLWDTSSIRLLECAESVVLEEIVGGDVVHFGLVFPHRRFRSEGIHGLFLSAVHEPRLAGLEDQIHVSDLAVTVLCDDELGLALLHIFSGKSLIVKAVDKEYHIRILLYGS